MKNIWRVYIQPFNSLGAYTGTWIDVTDDTDVQSISTLDTQIDNTQYDIGVFRNSGFTLKMNNQAGAYSDVGSPNTIFSFTRGNSQVKVTWEVEQEGGPICGVAICGDAYLSTEVEMFRGLIIDDAVMTDVETNDMLFQVLGIESVLERTPWVEGDTSPGEIGPLLSELLAVARTRNKNIFTVGTVALGYGGHIQDDSGYSTTDSFRSIIDGLLLVTNSVLVSSNGVISTAGRAPSSSVMMSFYGQGSINGPENIQAITDIKNGFARVFNYAAWDSNTATFSDPDSIIRYGYRPLPVINESAVTLVSEQLAMLTSIVTEFKTPKQEFTISTPITYASAALNMLDRVAIDYPIVYFSDVDPLPICGVAVCGVARTPTGLWGFTIPFTDNYKIMGRTVDVQNGLIKFKMRQI